MQRFEFTYGLCEAMLRRFLEVTTSGREVLDALSFPALIRTASEKELLLHGWDRWHDYRKARHQTSHTYNEVTALDVVSQLPAFLLKAQHLRTRLDRGAAESSPMAVEGSLTLSEHGRLADDFHESFLPIKVDILAPRRDRSRLPRTHRSRLRSRSRVIMLLS